VGAAFNDVGTKKTEIYRRDITGEFFDEVQDCVTATAR
jgi:hypothetical protein